MRISVLQAALAPGGRAANMERMRRMIGDAAADSADVIVMPELWDIGFYPANVVELSDPEGGEAGAFLSALARSHGVNIVGGSIARRVGNGVRNSCLVFDRKGERVALYDKCHLFSPGHEGRHFEPGNAAVTASLDGVTTGVLICYDLRFGEFAACLARNGAELLVVPAAWPHPRLEHWRLLLRARAVENQCFVAAANGCGMLGKLTFCGRSAVIAPDGVTLAEAGEEPAVLTADCDMSDVRAVRERIPVFADRRPELYGIRNE